MRLLLLADTHLPHRARDLPAEVWDEVDRSDVVVHAGDWVDIAALDALRRRATTLLACWGNNDGPDVRGRQIPVPVDTAALADLASTTGGTAYTAASSSQLKNVYDDIGKQVGTRIQRQSMAVALTGLALLLGLAAGAASLVWFRALP